MKQHEKLLLEDALSEAIESRRIILEQNKLIIFQFAIIVVLSFIILY